MAKEHLQITKDKTEKDGMKNLNRIARKRQDTGTAATEFDEEKNQEKNNSKIKLNANKEKILAIFLGARFRTESNLQPYTSINSYQYVIISSKPENNNNKNILILSQPYV